MIANAKTRAVTNLIWRTTSEVQASLSDFLHYFFHWGNYWTISSSKGSIVNNSNCQKCSTMNLVWRTTAGVQASRFGCWFILSSLAKILDKDHGHKRHCVLANENTCEALYFKLRSGRCIIEALDIEKTIDNDGEMLI